MHPFPTVHRIHSFFQHTINNTVSSSYPPKQVAHSFCKPSSAVLTCSLPLLVCFSFSPACFCSSSTFFLFAASLCLALHFFPSSLTSAFLFFQLLSFLLFVLCTLFSTTLSRVLLNLRNLTFHMIMHGNFMACCLVVR